LNLTTNELEYNDIHDFNTNHNNGVGLNTGFGIGTNKGESTLHPEKTTDVTIVHKGHDTEQTTHATIGAGNITVGGDTNPELAGLNRDTDKVQEITKDEITGALDSSVTVDNRVFTEEGRKQIAKQHEDFVDNAKQIGDGLRNNIVTKSIENAITDDTKNIIDTVGDYIEQDRQMTELQQKRQDLVQALNGLTNYDSAEARAVLQQVADFVAGTDGFTGDLKLANIDGNVVGFAYQSNDGSVKNISLNLANIDMTDPNALMNALYHETTNFERHTNNEQTAKNRGNTGAGIFDLKNYGNTNTNTMDNGQWLSNYGNTDTIQSGNMTFVKDVIFGADGTGKTNYSTYGNLDIDGKTLKITDAKADGSTAIIDNATGKVIAESLFDDSFVMYDIYGNPLGGATGNIIYLNEDKTPDIDSRVQQAATEMPWTVQNKSKNYQEYDIKNVYAIEKGAPSGTSKEEKIERTKYHYDGYMYNGKYDSARGLGNILFGRNAENMSLIPNWVIKYKAGMYQSQANNTPSNQETGEALKHIDYGINEQKNINTTNRINQINNQVNSLFPNGSGIEINTK
ncbi:MAG: hypothetical protein MJ187_04145, partial [Alphaproteobacteria bacterium]|nr:hypothetical protein [Alphaproteobacteria bacterium]